MVKKYCLSQFLRKWFYLVLIAQVEQFKHIYYTVSSLFFPFRLSYRCNHYKPIEATRAVNKLLEFYPRKSQKYFYHSSNNGRWKKLENWTEVVKSRKRSVCMYEQWNEMCEPNWRVMLAYGQFFIKLDNFQIR